MYTNRWGSLCEARTVPTNCANVSPRIALTIEQRKFAVRVAAEINDGYNPVLANVLARLPRHLFCIFATRDCEDKLWLDDDVPLQDPQTSESIAFCMAG